MASPYRWFIPLLFRHQNIFGEACGTRRFIQWKWLGWRLCFDIFPNASKSNDDPFFCGDIRWFRLATTNKDFWSAGALVLGIFIGSSLWWSILSGSVGIFRVKLDQCKLQWVIKISGAITNCFWFGCSREFGIMAARGTWLIIRTKVFCMGFGLIPETLTLILKKD